MYKNKYKANNNFIKSYRGLCFSKLSTIKNDLKIA